MRFSTLLAGLLITLLLPANTAHAAAYPIKDRVLTANKLYGTGKLQPSQCQEREVEPDDAAMAKRYLTSVLGCLNTIWGAHFKRAGLPFAKARIGFITKPRRYCGSSWGEAQAMYCDAEKRFIVLLNRDVLEDPSDLWLFRLAAHEYGHHVQRITGMARAYDRYPYDGKSELNEQTRRNELQAECLAGVFMGSVWDSLDRTDEDWEYLLDIIRESGDEQSKVRDHGKGRNIAAWLVKGFRASSPAACNTWTASSAKVS
ncbi:neutral zinc metallopeptidase [Nonomuraea sp. MTCD27]|uniref:neutral zinc metallopeptidase n=1 Tax=Nonomuraea sp. MTCD27 TaxID=1676747 RepID=UPI0035C10A39